MPPDSPFGDILLLAGDIVNLSAIDECNEFFDYLFANFNAVYWVPGNHEYYNSNINNRPFSINEAIRHNLFFVINIAVKHEDITFIFSTLWSNIAVENEGYIRMRLNDFHRIKDGASHLTIEKFNAMHLESLAFVKRELELNKGKKSIVITHHVPIYLNYPVRYKGDTLNDAFAVELFDLIESCGPDVWISGHIHDNHMGFTIGRTRLLTSQLGYVSHGEHENFNQYVVFVL